MEFFKVGVGGGMVSVTPAIAPLTVPTGPLPTVSTLSVGAAAASAGGAASVPGAVLAESNAEEAGGVKNILFLGVVGFLVYKYGRRFF